MGFFAAQDGIVGASMCKRLSSDIDARPIDASNPTNRMEIPLPPKTKSITFRRSESEIGCLKIALILRR